VGFPISDRLRRLPHFSLVGAIVTCVATGTNIVLLKYVHTPLILTWVCVYVVAINLSYFLNSIFTFQSALSFERMTIYYGIYLSAMGIGVALLKFYRAVLTWENWILPLLVLPITALWNFSLSSAFLKRRED
jgi:putative flippase GtrA